MFHCMQKWQTKAYALNFSKNLKASLIAAMAWSYTSCVLAQMAIDEHNGPFSGVICPMVKWMINLIIPTAAIAVICLSITFLWGAQITDMIQKLLYAIIAVTGAMAAVGIIGYVARYFGYSTQCLA